MSTLEMIEKDACYFDDWADGMTAHAVTEYARMEHGRNKDDDIWTAMEAGREAYYLEEFNQDYYDRVLTQVRAANEAAFTEGK